MTSIILEIRGNERLAGNERTDGYYEKDRNIASNISSLVLPSSVRIEMRVGTGRTRWTSVATSRSGSQPMTTSAEQLTTRWRLPDGTDIVFRPIRPQDAEIERAFVRNLSLQAKYFRFMQGLRELTPEMVERFTRIDQERDLALIATTAEGGKEIEIAVGRYFVNADGQSCEFAIVVGDAWQNKGIGTQLVSRLIERARARGLKRIEGIVLAQNYAMLEFVRHLGFSIQRRRAESEVYDVAMNL